MLRASTAVLIGACLLASTASSQITPSSVGFLFSTGNGGAGTFCGGFDCSPDPISVAAGDAVTLQVRGGILAPYVLGFSAPTGQCVSIPGVLNAVNLDPATALPLASGVLDELDAILACPGGRVTLTGIFPSSVPPGTVFLLQALTLGPAGNFAFTQAVEVTVL